MDFDESTCFIYIVVIKYDHTDLRKGETSKVHVKSALKKLRRVQATGKVLLGICAAVT